MVALAMASITNASYLADLVLFLHVGYVLFVLGGFFAASTFALTGRPKAASSAWFCPVHIIATGIVIAQAWLGHVCPLTRWESQLRMLAGQSPYPDGFIASWLHRLLYFDAPPWAFTAAYTVFGVLAVIVWTMCIRDRRRDLVSG